MNRRAFLRVFSALVAVGYFRPALAAEMVTGHSDVSNFKSVYGDEEQKAQFLLFLKNVYTLYPPDKFHEMIADVTAKNDTDEAIYKALQKRIPQIRTTLSPLTRDLPSLEHQKNEMEAQVATLLAGVKHADGYMEIGTPGRYVHAVKEDLHVTGQIYLLHTERPQLFSFTDIAERGQFMRIGKYVDMGNYKKIAAEDVPDDSLDLITNFIGFHHAPPAARDAFIASVAKKLRPGGRLILRDHNVDSDKMRFLVSLAHDVFNAGLNTPWDINAHEIRNFTTVAQIQERMHHFGLKSEGKGLLQKGDPTQNTLMLFVKA